MNDLLTLRHWQKGTANNEIPAVLCRYVPEWPHSNTETLHYPFGHVITVSHTDNNTRYISRTTHLPHKPQTFTITIQHPAVICYIRVKGAASMQVQSEHIDAGNSTMRIGYLPEGEIAVMPETGLGISIMIDIATIISQYADQSYQVQQLLQHIRKNPQQLLTLPTIPLNYWQQGVVHLLLNIGKDMQHRPSLHTCTHQLVRLYLIAMNDDISASTQQKLNFEVLSGRKTKKTYLLPNTSESFQYSAIENYLLQHLKTHLKKEEVATAMNIGEKEFVRLFKDGYGKPYREGYLELRMQKAFEQVMHGQDKLYNIARSIGYQQQSAFGERFVEFFGFPPTLYKWPYIKIKKPLYK
ncbi:AraC-type DNA-binding protein [Filimonas lacunae]|uniref:AraC-type DNA-binding protein n=1 Tax=Filimonas lacunae TaxID=477680 RepID=A0A173MQZ6_9BACT|nr:AraC family transcriptional regulator [Filimonas lacunae]BAV10095.1 hypothetical protein FLA_6150 [Filimonas lacunae]SIS83940.1 AraC-type DNA-binding protein [Filimonas lacunae]